MRLYLYVVAAVDDRYQPKVSSVKNGMSAPNVVNDIITLGTCKPMMRASLRKKFDQWHNYVVGLSPSHTDPRRVLYFMHIGELITFNEAWRRGEEDEAFKLKRGRHSPLTDDTSKVKMNGDIIVKSDNGIHYAYVEGVHQEDWDTYIIGGRTVGAKRDIYVVGDPHVSQYFWDRGPVFTERMFKRFWKGYPNMRGHRVLYGKEARDILGELNLH